MAMKNGKGMGKLAGVSGVVFLLALTFYSDSALAFELMTWKYKAPMPTARADLGVAEVNGKIYVIGGRANASYSRNPLTTVEMFDPATNTWTTRAPMPTARAGLAVAAVNGKIYAMAGDAGTSGTQVNLKTVEMYDPVANTWVMKASMNELRQVNATAAVVGLKIFVMGGFSSKLEVYDTVANSWVYKSAAPFSNGVGATSADGKVYLANSRTSSEFARYDPMNDAWSSCPPLPRTPECAASTVINGRIFTVISNPPVGFLGIVCSYDVGSGEWREIKPLTTPQYVPGVCAVAGKIYVIGGTDGSYVSQVVEESDIIDIPVDNVSQGSLQIRRNIVRVKERGSAMLILKGEPGASYTIHIYSEDGLARESIGNPMGGTLDSTGMAVEAFSGISDGRYLRTGQYWAVVTGAFYDRKPFIIVNE